MCPHLNSDKVELLLGGSSADPQFAHPRGNCVAMAHALGNDSQIHSTELPISGPGRKMWDVC